MDLQDPRQLTGVDVIGAEDTKIGSVEQVYLDEQTGRAEWATVKTGRLGGKVAFIPLSTAKATQSAVVIPYDKDFIKGAPSMDPDGELSPREEAQLFDYYGIAYGGETVTAVDAAPAPAATQSDDAMTRSEERLRVGKQQVETGRVRLRKYVVTENVTETVPVTREEVRVEREPITDENFDRATAGADISEAEHEVVLREERPVIAKETVPVERVRLAKDTRVDEETVTEPVRREQIETDGL